ncbi:MAG: phosphate ABC transporter permease [Spirulinaceae cyanobacterium]
MLVPLTREKFEQIVPLIATGSQYASVLGKVRDILRRVLISVVGVLVVWLLSTFLGDNVGGLKIILGSIVGLYWLWSPVYWASRRNAAYRKFPYSGFWRGRVTDVFVTDELIGEEETVNNRGELVIVENRERRINIEVADQSGFRELIQAPLKRLHKGIKPGQIAELVVLSKQPDLSLIAAVTDVYLPNLNLWVGAYPYLQRNVFAQVSSELRENYNYSYSSKRR